MDFHVDVHNVHIHTHDDQRLDAIERKLADLLAQGRKILMADQDVLDIVSSINDTTNQMAADVDKVNATLLSLRDQIKTGMTPAEVAEVKAALTGASEAQKVTAANLKATAADPANPAPEPEPIPEPA